MKKSIKGTQTEKNLAHAFAGESMARNKYTYFAKQAKKEGYNEIADIFLETAHNEMHHARLWFEFLSEGCENTTIENLAKAAAGENEEWTDMYAEFAKVARSEGLNHIAVLFEKVGAIEKQHEERYLRLLEDVKNGKVFAKEEEHQWICSDCGHVHTGTSAPKACPVCKESQAHFSVLK